MVKVTIDPGVKIDTFIKAETGGSVVADGLRIEGGEIGRFADASSGARISARGARINATVREGAVARTGGKIVLSNAVIRNLGAKASELDEIEFARKLTDQLNEQVSPETAAKLQEALGNAPKIIEVVERAKTLGIWDWISRVGGLVGLANALKNIFGL